MSNENTIVNKYHDWAIARIRAWETHAEKSREIYNEALSPSSGKSFSYQALVGKLFELGLSCYDTAVGSMYPPGPGVGASPPPPASANVKSGGK